MVARKVTALLKILISGALLIVIFYFVNWKRIGPILNTVNVFLVVLTVAFNALGVFLSIVKWKYLLDVKGIHKSMWHLHGIYYMAFFFNNFLPSMIGGDVFRMVRTAAPAAKRTEAICAVLVERGTGLVAMVVLTSVAAIWSLWRGETPPGLYWLYVCASLLFAALVFGGGLALLLSSYLERAAYRFRWLASAFHISEVLRGYFVYPMVLGIAFVLSIAFHLLLVTNAYLFAMSIGVRLDPFAMAVIFPLAVFIAMVPVSFNGFGVKEGALIVLLGQIGVEREQALIIAGLSRVFIVFASIGGGVLLLFDDFSLPSRVSSVTGISRKA